MTYEDFLGVPIELAPLFAFLRFYPLCFLLLSFLLLSFELTMSRLSEQKAPKP